MNKEECEEIGGEWVSSYRKDDGTVVSPFCRKIGRKRDRNGNTRDKWKREKETPFDMRDYTLKGGDIEGVVKKDLRNKNKVHWFVNVDGKRVSEGNAKNMRDAQYQVEEAMRRK